MHVSFTWLFLNFTDDTRNCRRSWSLGKNFLICWYRWCNTSFFSEQLNSVLWLCNYVSRYFEWFFFLLSFWCSYKQVLKKIISFSFCFVVECFMFVTQNDHIRVATLLWSKARHNFMYYFLNKNLSFCGLCNVQSKIFDFLQWRKKKIHIKYWRLEYGRKIIYFQSEKMFNHPYF